MENGYEYLNQNGKDLIAYAEKLSVRTSGKRNVLAQKRAGGDERLPTDEGGHLIAFSLNGSNSPENLVAMDRGLNRGLYRSNELAIKKAIERKPENNVSMRVHTNGSSKRPDVIQVTARMQNTKGKVVDECHNSYTNINKRIQEKLALESGTDFINYQETLTKEQRRLANLASIDFEKMKIPDGLDTGWIFYSKGNQAKSSLNKISITEKSATPKGKISGRGHTSEISSAHNSLGAAGTSAKGHNGHGAESASATGHGGHGTGGISSAGHGTGSASTTGHGGHGGHAR